jgi:hypothetical protein
MQQNKPNNFKTLNISEKQKLVSFFALLMKIDMRVNPNLYKNNNIKQ